MRSKIVPLPTLLLIVCHFFIITVQSQPVLPKRLQKELSNYVWVKQQTGKHFLLGTYLEAEPGSKPLDLRLPEHYEPLSDTFLFPNAWVSKTEITVFQYAAFLKDCLKLAQNDSNAIRNLLPACSSGAFSQNYCLPESERLIYNPAFQHYPIACVTYGQALAYCSWLTNRLNKLAAQEKSPLVRLNARIPTDLEYEFLMDASKITRDNCGAFPIGVGSCAQLTEDDGFKFLNPVRAFPANELGLFGLYGNAAEWTSDNLGEVIVRDIRAYQSKVTEERDESIFNIPTPVDDVHNYDDVLAQFQGIKVIKGGAYCTTPYRAKGTSRGACAENEAKCWNGFRTVIEVSQE